MLQFAFSVLFAFVGTLVAVHDGPDPVASWVLGKKNLRNGFLQAERGVEMKVQGAPLPEAVNDVSVLRFNGRTDYLTAESSWPDLVKTLPQKAFTISTWVSVDTTQPNGGIVSALQDNGDHEYGWVLGYNESSFSFALSTEGASDGNGVMTYLSAKTKIESGRWYHVVGIYDGQAMQIWVNGKLEGSSNIQHGAVLYPENTKLALGAYCDDNECFTHHGRIASIQVYDVAATEKWVTQDFSRQASWTELAPTRDPSLDFKFLVKPYLQYCTEDSIRVLCELTRKGKVVVEYGESSKLGNSKIAVSDDGLLHSALLDGLNAETGHYYQVVITEEGKDYEFRSELLSFQTASKSSSPFSFVIIADTQGNPKVNGKIANLAWGLRPNFLVLPGDLVDDGTLKDQWIHEFFASMNPLISRVPLFPVLGNHEKDASHYYRYMDLPAPEYYYSFKYGNCMFFVLDSNKKLDPWSEQYQWLEKQLEALREKEKAGTSDVLWKFVTFHHPVYSSDENDYGDLWKGKSSWGDMRLRDLVSLFDEYHIDVVWSGHIHSYERTWPLANGKNTSSKLGTTYMITGGGGGGLEQAGPIRPWFQNNVKRGHHFVFVAINGTTLELKSYDLDGHLFDTTTLQK